MNAIDPETLLPSPGVHFESGFHARLAALVGRLRASSERREGRGRAGLLGVGEEFVGYRPYRPGEDLRGLDWNLLARLDRPFVRVSRRESSEHWTILLDTSASMGVGRPGKLQCAAEVAAGIAFLGLRSGARIEIHTDGGDEVGRLEGRNDSILLPLLTACRARGRTGLGPALDPARLRDAGRVFLLSDFLDLEPDDVLRCRRRGRELLCARILAPEELHPAPGDGIRWIDAEGAGSAHVARDGATRHAYERALSAELEGWRSRCAAHGVLHGVFASDTSFEDIVGALLGG